MKLKHAKTGTENGAVIPAAFKHFGHFPDESFVRLPVVAALFACSPATVWRNVRAGIIPAPSRLGARCTGWNVGALRRALATAARGAK